MNQDGQINSADDGQRKSARMVKVIRRLQLESITLGKRFPVTI